MRHKKAKSSGKGSYDCCWEGCFDYDIRPVFAEFVGTTLFVFLVVMSLTAGTVMGTGLVQGLGLAALATALGCISGGHFNPALTFAAVFSGAMHVKLAICYWIVQILGSITGAALAKAVLTQAEYNAISGGVTLLHVEPIVGFVLELLLTFILTLVFAVAALDYKAPGAGFAVGLVVLVDVIVGANKTGASMNPARSLGPLILWHADNGHYEWKDSWVYWGGTFAGAALAAILYRFILADPKHRKVCVDESVLEDSDEETR